MIPKQPGRTPAQQRMLKQLVHQTMKPATKFHYSRWNTCEKCRIGQLCNRKVFFRGYLPCEVLIIGEAPGQSEDALGIPFVGPAGGCLDEIMLRVERDFKGPIKWCIGNTVLCRPTTEAGKNRPPAQTELEQCRSRLMELITLAQPRLVVAAGKVAMRALLPLTNKRSNQPGIELTEFPVRLDMDWIINQFHIDTVETLMRAGGKQFEYIHWTAPIVEIYHPQWMAEHAKDPENEINKAATTIVRACQKVIVPF